MTDQYHSTTSDVVPQVHAAHAHATLDKDSDLDKCKNLPTDLSLPSPPPTTCTSPTVLKMTRLTEYMVIGRHLPTEKEPSPKLYRMRIFAVNKSVAESRFWYFVRQLRKMKKATGEIVAMHAVSININSSICIVFAHIEMDRKQHARSQDTAQSKADVHGRTAGYTEIVDRTRTNGVQRTNQPQ